MTVYAPDNWVVIKIKSDDPHYRVLAGWSGGYLHGTSWKLNSGITSVTVDGNVFAFAGSSGSVYNCHKDAYGLRMNNAYIWNQLQDRYGDKVELMSEETDWLKTDWIINAKY